MLRGSLAVKVTEGPVFELDVALNEKTATVVGIGFEVVTQVQAEAPAPWLVTGWITWYLNITGH